MYAAPLNINPRRVSKALDILVCEIKKDIIVPLFLEVRDFMFFRREKTHNQPFCWFFFEGAETFLTSKMS
jgi:hypothetical protein